MGAVDAIVDGLEGSDGLRRVNLISSASRWKRDHDRQSKEKGPGGLDLLEKLTVGQSGGRDRFIVVAEITGKFLSQRTIWSLRRFYLFISDISCVNSGIY